MTPAEAQTPPAAEGRAGRPESSTGPADYARACVRAAVKGTRMPAPPPDALFTQRAACFVSLKKHGELRGCIGTLAPAEPDLGREVARNAHAAAFQDPRFPPVNSHELDDLSYSVDVLSPSRAVSAAELDPQRYGVIVSCGYRRGVLLPDLPGVDSVNRQLRIALQKAGIGLDEPYEVRCFRVTRYREGDAVGVPSDAIACSQDGEEGAARE